MKKNTKKIIIIEDEEPLGQIYFDTLKSAGYDTRWLRSAEGIDELSENFQADLILVDHALSGRNITCIKALPALKRLFPNAIIIIIFSNYSDFALKKKAKRSGADDFWLKMDISLAELLRRVQSLLREPNDKLRPSK